jgi:hypothetical protein
MTMVKGLTRPALLLIVCQPAPKGDLSMNFQKMFEKSENTAVFIAVLLFFVFHFGMLMLFNLF